MKDQLIVLVNKKGEPIGTAPRLETHHSDTPLHLAFSTYIFNERGELLVTKRYSGKKVWPGVWTNSCCGHPTPGEYFEEAIKRRADFELGLKVKSIKMIVPNYTYKTPQFKGIVENEFCPIFIAVANSDISPNPEEVEDYEWMKTKVFIDRAEHDSGNVWSWWCKDQIKHLKARSEFTDNLNK